MNLLNDQSSHNFHFVVMSIDDSTAEANHIQIDVDSEDGVVRTEKRILWTQEEDVRLVSCSLFYFCCYELLPFSFNIDIFFVDECLVREFDGFNSWS
jgi:hypothetical protein